MENNGINGIEMDSLALEYKSLKGKIDALTKQLDAVQSEIKSALGSVHEYRTETFHFVFRPVFSSRFDSTAFKNDNPVIAEQYTYKVESRPLKIY